MLQVITPTGDRPEAWRLCQMFMARQTITSPVVWHVVDDGVEEMPADFRHAHIELKKYRLPPRPGENTQGRNLQFLLDRIDPAHPVTVWEDDDYYKPEWLACVAREIQTAEIVGEIPARYYNVRWRRCDELSNYRHASLRCTAMRDSAIETFRDVLKTPHPYYDMRLWPLVTSRHLFPGSMTVGIKALPGRAGIATGHAPNSGRVDRDWHRLRQWIGADAALYEEFYEKRHDMHKRMMVAHRPFPYASRRLEAGEQFEVDNEKDALYLRLRKWASPVPASSATRPQTPAPTADALREERPKKSRRREVGEEKPPSEPLFAEEAGAPHEDLPPPISPLLGDEPTEQ